MEIAGLIHNDNTIYNRKTGKEGVLPVEIANSFSVGIIVNRTEDEIKIKSDSIKGIIRFNIKEKKDNLGIIADVIPFEELKKLCERRRNFLVQSQKIILNVFNIVDKDVHSDTDYKYLTNEFLKITHEDIRKCKNLFNNDITNVKFNNEQQINDFLINTVYAPSIYYIVRDLLELYNTIDRKELKEEVYRLNLIESKYLNNY